jgi:hypothetical protein
LSAPAHAHRQPWLSLQEMAERRQRQASDRRLISDRTAKGLRTLAAPQRVYRDRTGRGVAARRPLYLTDYLPPDEMDLDDDNDSLESMVDPSGAVEGARINSDLYDAYANPGSCSFSLFSRSIRSYPIDTPASTDPHISPTPPHLRHMLRSATRREDWVLLRDTSPDGWGPPSPTTAPSAPPLTRQPSIRRLPARSRTVDFTDFTSRRRSSGREGNNNVVPGPEPEADDSASGTTTATLSSRLSPNTTWVPPRRFFPTRRPELPWSPESTGSSTGTGSGMGSGTGAAATPSARSSPAPSTATTATTTPQPEGRSPRTFLSWLPSSALLSLPPPPPADLRGSRTIPRLRRGGVRPPESLLGHDMTMLRTESPEPMPGSNGGTTAAGASAGMEGDVPSLSNASTVSPGTTAVPVGTPRAQSPTPAE